MYADRLFVRTPAGDAALAERGLQEFSYRVHMVLKLCDGTNRYDFLRSNLRRVDNLSDIVRHLLENGLVEEVVEPARGRNRLGRGFFAGRLQARAAAEPKAIRDDFEAEVRSGLAEEARGEEKSDPRKYFKALSAMSEVLSELFSDEVLEWSMDAEGCDSDDAFEALVERFEEIYAKHAGAKQAGALVKQLQKDNPVKKVA